MLESIDLLYTLPVAGIVPLTTTDYPDRLSMVVFLQGCPWRCPYCHNAELQPRNGKLLVSWNQVNGLLQDRRGFLEAVVFSGGEPTLHPNLKLAMQSVREKGFLVGLHTAGMYPDRLDALLPWLDWVGLDVKAPFDERYCRITGDPNSVSKVVQSLKILMSAETSWQLRTTVGPGALSEADFADLQAQLSSMGAPDTVRQEAKLV